MCTKLGIGSVNLAFIPVLNLNILYFLNNDKRIRHTFFNLVLSSPYTYNIQYGMDYYYIIKSLKIQYETINVTIKQNATMENRPEYKNLGHRQ